MPIGFSYAPGADIPMNGEGNGRAPSRLTPQQAVKILSLRVQDPFQANAPINPSLFNSPGSLFGSLIAQLANGRVQVPGLQPGAIDTGLIGGPRPPQPFTPTGAGPGLPTPPPPRVRPGGGDDDRQPVTAAPAVPMQPTQPTGNDDPLLSFFRQFGPSVFAGSQGF